MFLVVEIYGMTRKIAMSAMARTILVFSITTKSVTKTLWFP